jgi:hypothetical protein
MFGPFLTYAAALASVAAADRVHVVYLMENGKSCGDCCTFADAQEVASLCGWTIKTVQIRL